MGSCRGKEGPIDQATARNELDDEIKAALTDIDCGKTCYQLHDEETRAMYPALG